MLPPDSLRPEQRVLVLGIPERAAIVELAARLSSGLVVAMGSEEEVRAARRDCAALDNVMFVVLEGDRLPWQDSFFHHVIDVHRSWTDADAIRREIERVSAAST